MDQNKSKGKDLLKEYMEILPNQEIQKELNKKNVIPERFNIMRSFILNLCHNVTSTYLGMNHVKTLDDIVGHYTWGFNKTCSQFNEQDIDFTNNIVIYDYFLENFLSTLYENEDYHETHILTYWNQIFSQEYKHKTRHDLNVLIELYELLDVSFMEKLDYE